MTTVASPATVDWHCSACRRNFTIDGLPVLEWFRPHRCVTNKRSNYRLRPGKAS